MPDDQPSLVVICKLKPVSQPVSWPSKMASCAHDAGQCAEELPSILTGPSSVVVGGSLNLITDVACGKAVPWSHWQWCRIAAWPEPRLLVTRSSHAVVPDSTPLLNAKQVV